MPTASGLVLALTGAIAFSGKAIIVKLAYRHGVDAVTLIMYRMVMAFPFFVLLAWWASRQAHAKANPLTRRDVGSIVYWASLAITSPVTWIFWACNTSAPAWSG